VCVCVTASDAAAGGRRVCGRTILGDEGVHKPHVCGHADLVSTSHSFALWAEHAESYWSLQSALSEQSKRYGYHVFWYHGGSAATAATAAMRREICMQIPRHSCSNEALLE